MSVDNISQLCNALLVIEAQLDQLSGQHASSYAQFAGQDFLEQQDLAADKLDNLILAATHETASSIGFLRQNINQLTQFIKFRVQFKQFTDQELSQIIDNPALSMAEKIPLYAKCTPDRSTLMTIQTTWNGLFNQHGYAKIKSVLNI
jgi:hypothetical protein